MTLPGIVAHFADQTEDFSGLTVCLNPLTRSRDCSDQGPLAVRTETPRKTSIENEYIFLVGISRMTGCAYHLLWRHKLSSA